MKALMFGWEFPPHILGGLGTASYGLTRGMWECGDMDITFVIPKPYGDEDPAHSLSFFLSPFLPSFLPFFFFFFKETGSHYVVQTNLKLTM